MNISQFIKNLQDKPLKTRNRILLAGSSVAVVLVVGVWFTSFRKEIKNINVSDISSSITQTVADSAPHYLSVDSAEVSGGNLLIYFSVHNDTTDILNFSTAADVKLTASGQTYTPSKVTGRTQAPFVQKVLSNTTEFGILTFDTAASGSGTIIFDNLYFEQSPDSIFKETDNLDLSKLPKPDEVRN
ncbi:MAG TPA: hypothetical protein VFX17_02685 [Patescibacteria group bacterium]|nr:hypothetical protein [Patescibacteria group bacterium]